MMKLKDLIHQLMIKEVTGDIELEITGIQMDSRKVEPGNLFICVPGIKGFLEDRHQFAKAAVKNGAAALVLEHDVEVDVTKIFVNNARYAMAVISSYYFGYPSNEMKLIGITGTNGKTTTSYIIDKIFSDFGFKTGLMGNNGIKIDNIQIPTDINTQEPPILQHNLRKMKDCHTEYCIMEVTSQGLDFGRVLGCNFRTAIFTNLTQDHIDYHGTFENYRNAKGLFFSRLGNSFSPIEKKFAILNSDDPSFEFFQKITPVEVITYGMNEQADVSASNIKVNSKGITFLLKTFEGQIDIELKLIGKFNIYNALASITTALVEGIPLIEIKNSLAELTSIPGRMEIVNHNRDFLVIVDYAHTPDALENVLSTLKELAKGKIITVFGCGGDRDKTKRPIMGRIALQNSDYIFITSDNPRSEDPIKIMMEIEEGLVESNNGNYELDVLRESAIKKAISMASSDDIVLIAGKGHENYQILKDKTIPFDDKLVASAVLLEIE
jgi:UDP-N-acetylmuramoyl-L-alanyl-D-glutamate--2,6-diaminopimelate ligase